MPRTRKRTPSDERRKEKRAAKRIAENSKRRSELMHMLGGEGKANAGASKAVLARTREQVAARVPARLEIARLTDHLAEDFTDLRDDKAGTVPVPPKGPMEMQEENTRHHGIPKKRWRGE